MFLSIEKFPTRVAVERHLEAFVLKLNSENAARAIHEPTFKAVLDRFIEEEKLLEISSAVLVIAIVFPDSRINWS